jgi:hypothetical protein
MEAMSEDLVQRWRTQIESEFGLYSAAEAARRAGSRGHSRTAAVHRWVEAGKVFAVTSTAGLDAYAGFCFGEDGRPVPGIGAVIKAFAGRVSGWDLARGLPRRHRRIASRNVAMSSDPPAGMYCRPITTGETDV